MPDFKKYHLTFLHGALSILFVLHQLTVGCQSNPTFSPFKGTVYDILPDELELGYGDHLIHWEIMGEITLDSLIVPETLVNVKYFPGVTMRTRYGIVFSSSLEIKKKGCYEFYLESDDGSILWINDKIVIDNDKPHRMIAKRDTMMMETGAYPVKVWYYNAYVGKYGLILRCRALPDSVCAPVQRKVEIDFNNVLFDFNSYTIKPEGMKELDRLVEDLNKLDFKKMLIVGHTDNVGTAKYNEELSLKRAQSILTYVKARLKKPDIIFKAEGKGFTNPIALDENEDAQKINRRVEIYIE